MIFKRVASNLCHISGPNYDNEHTDTVLSIPRTQVQTKINIQRPPTQCYCTDRPTPGTQPQVQDEGATQPAHIAHSHVASTAAAACQPSTHSCALRFSPAPASTLLPAPHNTPHMRWALHQPHRNHIHVGCTPRLVLSGLPPANVP